MGSKPSRVDVVPAEEPRHHTLVGDKNATNIVTAGNLTEVVATTASDAIGEDDVDGIRLDVVAWQRKHCNDGYYDNSDPQDILMFLDPHVLQELAKSVETTMDTVGQRSMSWKRGELLGSGAFGRVYLGLNEVDGTLMAAKQIPLNTYSSGDMNAIISLMEREITLMSRLRHPNIVQYLGSQRDEYVKENGSHDEFLTIFMEYVPGGSIASLLRKFGRFNDTLLRIYTKQILMGLAYLHAHAVVHRDIKGGNILVDRSGVCKLSDFGASKSLGDLETASANEHGPKSLRGTPAFMAPEVIKQTGYGRKSDIWSVGCTVIEMASGKPPWSNYDNPVAAMFAIAVSNELPQLPPDISKEAVDFIHLCLQRDPHERPTAAELLRHPFICGTASSASPSTQAATTPVADRASTVHKDAGRGDVAVEAAGRVDEDGLGTSAAKPVNPFGRRKPGQHTGHTRNSSAPDVLGMVSTSLQTVGSSYPSPASRTPPSAEKHSSFTSTARAEENERATETIFESPLEALAKTVRQSQRRKIPASGLNAGYSTLTNATVFSAIKNDAAPSAMHFTEDLSLSKAVTTPGSQIRGIHGRRRGENKSPNGSQRNSLSAVAEVSTTSPLSSPGLWTSRRIRVAPQELMPQAEDSAPSAPARLGSWGEHMYQASDAEAMHAASAPKPRTQSWFWSLFARPRPAVAPPVSLVVEPPAAVKIAPKSAPPPKVANKLPFSSSIVVDDVDINVDTVSSLARVRDLLEEDVQAVFARINASDTEMGMTYSKMFFSPTANQSLGIHGKGAIKTAGSMRDVSATAWHAPGSVRSSLSLLQHRGPHDHSAADTPGGSVTNATTHRGSVGSVVGFDDVSRNATGRSPLIASAPTPPTEAVSEDGHHKDAHGGLHRAATDRSPVSEPSSAKPGVRLVPTPDPALGTPADIAAKLQVLKEKSKAERSSTADAGVWRTRAATDTTRSPSESRRNIHKSLHSNMTPISSPA